RGVLRQAPDVIMIGEIRDPVTAETAVRAANSGHLVLATLHASSAIGAVQSLQNLNVPQPFLATALRGVISQRLVRTLCPHCKEACDVSFLPDFLGEVMSTLPRKYAGQFHVAQECDNCHHTGYAGRTGVFEVLEVGEEFRRFVFDREPAATL